MRKSSLDWNKRDWLHWAIDAILALFALGFFWGAILLWFLFLHGVID